MFGSKLSPVLRTSTGSSSSPRTSVFPNSIIKQRQSVTTFGVASATASNNTTIRLHRQAGGTQFCHIPLRLSRSSQRRATRTVRQSLELANPRAPINGIHQRRPLGPLHALPGNLARIFTDPGRSHRPISWWVLIITEISPRSNPRNLKATTAYRRCGPKIWAV